MRGNHNAAKPPGERRVPICARVHPQTVMRLRTVAPAYGSRGRAIDEAVSKL